MKRAFALCAVTTMAVSCSSQSQKSDREGATTGSVPTKVAQQIVAELRRVPDLSAAFASPRELVRVGNSFRLHRAAPARGGELEASLPGVANGTLHLAISGAPDTWLEVWPTDLGDVAALPNGNALVMPGVTDQTDIVYAATEGSVEELRILRGDRAPTTLRWHVRVGPGLAGVRLRAGRIESFDRNGRAWIQSAPMFAVDSEGARTDLHVTAEEHDGVLEVVAEIPASTKRPLFVDPAWHSIPPMNKKRIAAAAIALGDIVPGDTRILVAGGQLNDDSNVSSSELYDWKTNTWTASETSMFGGHARYDVVPYQYAGKWGVLAVGGTSGGAGTKVVEWFDPTAGAWTHLTDLPIDIGEPSTAVCNGAVFTLGGLNGSAGLYDVRRFDGTSWKSMTHMTSSRFAAGVAVVGSPQKLVVVGGKCTPGASDTPCGSPYVRDDAEVFDCPTAMTAVGTWTPKGSIDGLHDLAGDMRGRSAVLSDGAVFLGSFIPGGSEQTKVYKYTATSGMFDATTFAALPSSPRQGGPRTVVIPGSPLETVLLTGGDFGVASTVYAKPAGAWNSAALKEGRGQHTATRFDADRVLVAGGRKDLSVELSTAEVFSLRANGQACDSTLLGIDCDSGFCVDGVCCDTACTGTCNACSASLKASGANGVCGPAKAGSTDPGCTDSGAASCGTNGKCDGAGACQKYTVCRAASCDGVTATAAASCPATGGCPAITTTICSPYKGCVGTLCKTSCGTSADCVAGRYCALGVCQPQKADLASCSKPEECASGICAGCGVCGPSCPDAGSDGGSMADADGAVPDSAADATDTGTPTPDADTTVEDSAMADTSVIDTSVIDTSVIDTSVIDTSVVMDATEDDAATDAANDTDPDTETATPDSGTGGTPLPEESCSCSAPGRESSEESPWLAFAWAGAIAVARSRRSRRPR